MFAAIWQDISAECSNYQSPMSDNNDLRYRRSRFSTRLPLDRVYSPAHFWLREIGPRTYEVGYTRFATRMLGDFVEMAFEVTPRMKITRGQTIGWIEGFKAASDLISAADGTFLGTNPTLEADITTIESDTYGSGWLYSIECDLPPDALSAEDYAGLLDGTIDAYMAGQG